MRIGDVEVNVTDPENLDFYEDLAKREYQEKKVNAEVRERKEKEIDEQIKQKKEQIHQLKDVINLLKEEVFSLEKTKESLDYKTLFDDRNFAQQHEFIEFKVKLREERTTKSASEDEFDFKCKIYEQIKDKLGWLDFETTKELLDDEVSSYCYFDNCDETPPNTELQNWFYSQTCPIDLELNLSSALLYEFQEPPRTKEFDDYEELSKEREKCLKERLDLEVNSFYKWISFYLACQKYSEDLRDFDAETKRRVFRSEVEFFETYNA